MTTKASLTSRQVQGEVYRLLRLSPMAGALSGGVYRAGLRPRDSRREDAVVVFTTGLTGEVETGVVTINVYVPDIDPRADGVWVEDVRRTEQVERMAAEWAASLTAATTGNYLFRLSGAIETHEEAETRQHFVTVRLRYSYYDTDY